MTEPLDFRTLSIEQLIEHSNTLVEALPYISRFRGATIVIKYGGHAMVDEKLKALVIQDIALMTLVGMHPVIVHGGGPEITAHMNRLGLKPQFIAGQRVTDAETVEVAEMVLAGKINSEITLALNQLGCKAVGLSGKDMGLILARKYFHQDDNDSPKTDIGFVGEVVRIEPEIIEILTQKQIVPVISPIGVDRQGQTYNINADTVAAAVAGRLGADKLILLTDVPGILKNPKDVATLIHWIRMNEVEPMIGKGVITGGMIPKVRACLAALHQGVKKTHILDGRLPHSLLLEIFTDRGIGTQITP